MTILRRLHRSCRVVAASLWLTGTAHAEQRVLADPARLIAAGERVDFTGNNEINLTQTSSGVCLRSRPRMSATGLYQRVDTPPAGLHRVSWRWVVEQIHTSADIRRRESEDFAAKIAFVFGEPSWINRDVPTLAYVWTSTPVPDGSVLASTRYSRMKYIHLHGRSDAGAWQTEVRDIDADFRAVFGVPPPELRYIAIFNDNDQTGEPVSALFGRIISLD